MLFLRRLIPLLLAAASTPATWAADSTLDSQRPLPAQRVRDMTAAGSEEAFARYHALLSLPNDAHFPEDIERLLAWLQPQFAALGFSTTLLHTGSNPVLYLERPASATARTLLVYLQADGQPVDRSAWQQEDPYTPVLKRQDDTGAWQDIPWDSLQGKPDPDWRIFARSAADSKGPMAQFMSAIAALNANDLALDYNLKVIVDTEEEMGSPNLAATVAANRDLLAADSLIIFDGPPHASNKPTVTFGARGLATLTLVSYGPLTPQHSGHYGNFVANPAFHLARILASMKSADGRVLIDGFYDGIDFSKAEREQLDAVPDDPAVILQAMGVLRADSVADTLQESLQYPSLNIRGMRSGWVGTEVRTVIPATAVAEIDMRLVLESDPDYLIGLVEKHIASLGYTVLDHEPTPQDRQQYERIVSLSATTEYAAFRSDFDSSAGRFARAGMRNLYGEEPILIRTMGGSVPIAPFVALLDVPAVIVPTVNMDNNQHSPNENLRLGNFIEGISIMISILNRSLE